MKKLQVLVTCIGIFQDFAVSKPLEELVWPEMPFAPPESDCGDGDNETMEHPAQFRDTSVCPPGASGSSFQAGRWQDMYAVTFLSQCCRPKLNQVR